ncbi:MAG: lipoyl(octanoyl) transferase LipB [Anaerolineales bacterium]
MIIEDLGLIPYKTAWALQDEYAAQIAAGTRPPTLLLLEHPHVYTFGRKGHAENLLWNEEQLAQKNIAVHWVDRGGDVTYHGPGQLVGYPLLQLDGLQRRPPLEFQSQEALESVIHADYVGYIRNLEKMLIIALSHFGIVGGQRSGKSGVWIQADVYSRCPRCKPEEKRSPAKIAAIGVKVDARGITRHGFALNVNPQMEYFDGIIACGLNEPVVSLADLHDPPPSMDAVKQAVIESFTEVFEK